MTTIINGSSPSITFSDGSAQTSATQPFQNRIINGAMTIAQRGTGSIAVDNGNWYYAVDRTGCYMSATGSKFTAQQNAGSVTPPVGFTNYLGITSTSAYTVGASEWSGVRQVIEGFNVADLGWGTANAKTVTLSFWVRSSGLTYPATFGGAIYNGNGSRSYPFTYTINSASTWEYKTVTIAGDTTGTWDSTNGASITPNFSMGTGATLSGPAGAWAGTFYASATGATSVVGTNGATWFVTGVQLEVGSTATSFDYRPYGTELALCLRYFETNYPAGVATGSASLPGFVSTNSSTNSSGESSGVQFSVKKRAVPTIVIYHITTGTAGQVYRVGDAASVGATPTHIGQSGIGFLALASSSANGYYWNYTASAEL